MSASEPDNIHPHEAHLASRTILSDGILFFWWQWGHVLISDIILCYRWNFLLQYSSSIDLSFGILYVTLLSHYTPVDLILYRRGGFFPEQWISLRSELLNHFPQCSMDLQVRITIRSPGLSSLFRVYPEIYPGGIALSFVLPIYLLFSFMRFFNLLPNQFLR